MCCAVKGMEFARPANRRNHATGMRAVDKQHILTLPDRQVCRLIDAGRQQVQIGMGNLHQELAPVVFPRQSPHRRPQQKILPPWRAGQKASAA